MVFLNISHEKYEKGRNNAIQVKRMCYQRIAKLAIMVTIVVSYSLIAHSLDLNGIISSFLIFFMRFVHAVWTVATIQVAYYKVQ